MPSAKGSMASTPWEGRDPTRNEERCLCPEVVMELEALKPNASLIGRDGLPAKGRAAVAPRPTQSSGATTHIVANVSAEVEDLPVSDIPDRKRNSVMSGLTGALPFGASGTTWTWTDTGCICADARHEHAELQVQLLEHRLAASQRDVQRLQESHQEIEESAASTAGRLAAVVSEGAYLQERLRKSDKAFREQASALDIAEERLQHLELSLRQVSTAGAHESFLGSRSATPSTSAQCMPVR